MRWSIAAGMLAFTIATPVQAQAPGPVVGPVTSPQIVTGTTQGISGTVNPVGGTKPAPAPRGSGSAGGAAPKPDGKDGK